MTVMAWDEARMEGSESVWLLVDESEWATAAWQIISVHGTEASAIAAKRKHDARYGLGSSDIEKWEVS